MKCTECGAPLTGRQRYTCGSTCRAARSRRRTGRDTRTLGKTKALRSAAKRRSRRVRTGTRAATLYRVGLDCGDSVLWLCEVLANKPERAVRAVREVRGGVIGEHLSADSFCAVPARSLR